MALQVAVIGNQSSFNAYARSRLTKHNCSFDQTVAGAAELRTVLDRAVVEVRAAAGAGGAPGIVLIDREVFSIEGEARFEQCTQIAPDGAMRPVCVVIATHDVERDQLVAKCPWTFLVPADFTESHLESASAAMSRLWAEFARAQSLLSAANNEVARLRTDASQRRSLAIALKLIFAGAWFVLGAVATAAATKHFGWP